MRFGFGVDVGGTTIKIAFFQEDGLMIDKWEIPTNTDNGGSAILPDIAQAVTDYLHQHSVSPEQIIGIGIGVPGPVDTHGTVNKCINLGWGTVNLPPEQIIGIGIGVPGPVDTHGTVNKCINLGWGTVNLHETLSRLTGFDVRAGNDANVAALGECWKGGGQGAQNMVLATLGTGILHETLSRLTGFDVRAGNDANVAALGECWKGGGQGAQNMVLATLGTGIGGGIVTDGHLVCGAHGAGGEIGHIVVNRDETERCPCGNYGCIEQYGSGGGIVTDGHLVCGAHGAGGEIGHIVVNRDETERCPCGNYGCIEQYGSGGGIVTDGHLVCGAHGAGGEIGHIVVNRDETERCPCGNYGCIEQYGSATGVVRLAKRYLTAHDTPSVLRQNPDFSCKDVFDAAKAGDKAAHEITEQMFDLMGVFVAAVCAVADPEVVVLGGGVSKAGQILVDGITPYFQKYAFHACRSTQLALATLAVADPEVVVLGGGVSKAGQILVDGITPYFQKYAFHACRSTQLALATLGNDAGVYGAFKLVLDAFGG